MASYDRIRRANSAFMTTLTALCTLMAVGALLVILAHIAWQGVGSLNLQFLIDRPRPVGEGGGIGNAIVGSLLLLLISSAFGLPLGICVGIYLSEIGRGRLGGAVRFIVDTLTGIPSIVTGVFVYTIIVVPTKHFSALAGGVALALGATKWEMIRVVLVNGAPGIAGAVILGLGRALGETMAVTMVIGNRPQISLSLFDPSYTIASAIANEFTEATGDLYLSSLVELGLILFLVTFIVNGIARILVWNVTRQTGGVGRAA